jgi:serpin B
MRCSLGMVPLLLAACAASADSGQSGSGEPAPTPASAEAFASAAEANRAFGLSLYQQLAAEPGNVVISPISLAGAFGPVSAGAQGETRAAIGRILRFPAEDARLHSDLGGMLRELESDRDGARVSIANALWLMLGFPVKPEFVAIAERSYDAEVDTLDFRDGAAAARRINGWVDRETKGRIRELVDADTLDEYTALVVTNAVHFLGDWQQPFSANNTRPQPFHLADGSTREVPLMYAKRRVRYAETGDVQLVDLPYEGERLSMSVILPKRRGGLAEVERGLSESRLTEWLRTVDAARPQDVRIHLPRVQTETSYQLVEPLTAMGMGVAFDRQDANFRGIADQQLFISQVVHKTYLRIDEKGTEAAAATGIEVEVTSAPPSPPPVFRADHPFLFLIRDKATGAVLFLGRIAVP